MTVKDFLENEDFILFMLIKDSESLKHWESYLDKHPEDKVYFESAKNAFKKMHFDVKLLERKDRDLLYNRIFDSSKKNKVIKIRKRRRLYTAVAACILIFILFRIYKSTPQKAAEILVEQPVIEPKIELITSGETITLENNQILTVSQEGVINTKDEKLQGSDATTYNILKVPFGKRSELILADGSKLWVNSGSIVKFPSKFNDNKRTIYLEGEIYIEVTKDSLKPFHVETSNFNVNVYGTTFNVKAYKNSTEEQKVVLVEGSVGVATIDNMKATMTPNESLEITASKLVKENVDTEIYTSWKNGYLIFDNKPLEGVLIELSRYYNVTFLAPDKELINKRCTGKIYLSSNLNDVLETISTLSGSSFKMKKNK